MKQKHYNLEETKHHNMFSLINLNLINPNPCKSHLGAHIINKTYDDHLTSRYKANDGKLEHSTTDMVEVNHMHSHQSSEISITHHVYTD